MFGVFENETYPTEENGKNGKTNKGKGTRKPLEFCRPLNILKNEHYIYILRLNRILQTSIGTFGRCFVWTVKIR